MPTFAYVAGASKIDAQNRIVRACEKHWSAWSGDCSGFVKAVAKELGLPLPSIQANGLVDHIQQLPWRKLASGVEAAQQAKLGKLVLAGHKSSPNGHVVIVVPGGLAKGKYPVAYWGSLGGQGRKYTTLNYSFPTTQRDQLVYACRNAS